MDSASKAALQAVAARARSERDRAEERLAQLLSNSPHGIDFAEAARRHARLTVNFHPDRIASESRTVAAGLRATGQYRSQFETGISSGERSAVPGGRRMRWEAELFNDAYAPDSRPRPVYGALDVTRDPHGGSPRFGSGFLILREHCFDRATFCVGDSHVGPTDLGVISEFQSIMAGLLEQGARGAGLDRGLTTADLISCLLGESLPSTAARDLDGYIEAQVHGGISLADDVESIVLDPSFMGTRVNDELDTAAEQFEFRIEWHDGSELAAADFPADFRGPGMLPLAQRVARDDGVVDAAAIGRSLATAPFSPPSPGGDPANGPFQQHKKLWHCLLSYGGASVRPGTS